MELSAEPQKAWLTGEAPAIATLLRAEETVTHRKSTSSCFHKCARGLHTTTSLSLRLDSMAKKQPTLMQSVNKCHVIFSQRFSSPMGLFDEHLEKHR